MRIRHSAMIQRFLTFSLFLNAFFCSRSHSPFLDFRSALDFVFTLSSHKPMSIVLNAVNRMKTAYL